MRAPVRTCLLLAALSGALALSCSTPADAQSSRAPGAPGVTCHKWGTNVASPGYTCVSSHLAPAGARSYGPDMLDGISDGAWCEGAADHGVGQWISVTYGMPMKIQRAVVENGYNRTAATFRNNGRVRRMKVETSNGTTLSATLKDQVEFQEIKLPRPETITWIRFTIEDVVPGARGHDMCLSELVVDIEQFNLDESEPEDSNP